jgi:hypothetical protein
MDKEEYNKGDKREQENLSIKYNKAVVLYHHSTLHSLKLLKKHC